MTVYRITHEIWAGKLTGSGKEARWNRGGSFIIYAAGTLSLACLENLVHINKANQSILYKATLIDIPENIDIGHVNEERLGSLWKHPLQLETCQQIGAQWLEDNKYCVLRTPSAIITGEFNFLINPAHKDFKKISVKSIETFVFDKRLFK